MFEPEEYRIVKRIKEYIKDEEPLESNYIMLRNGRILDIRYYLKMLSDGKLTPNDAYVYIIIYQPPPKTIFYYPFLGMYFASLNAYLSKLGFHYEVYIVPATGLRYAAIAVYYEQYLSIEVVNLDTAVNNTNLPKIVAEVVGEKLISGESELTKDEIHKILDMFESQRLFAGYNFNKAWNIIRNYYEGNIKPSVKEVSRIGIDYYRIFNPYRVCYNMETWKEVDCSTIR